MGWVPNWVVTSMIELVTAFRSVHMATLDTLYISTIGPKDTGVEGIRVGLGKGRGSGSVWGRGKVQGREVAKGVVMEGSSVSHRCCARRRRARAIGSKLDGVVLSPKVPPVLRTPQPRRILAWSAMRLGWYLSQRKAPLTSSSPRRRSSQG